MNRFCFLIAFSCNYFAGVKESRRAVLASKGTKTIANFLIEIPGPCALKVTARLIMRICFYRYFLCSLRAIDLFSVSELIYSLIAFQLEWLPFYPGLTNFTENGTNKYRKIFAFIFCGLIP